MNSIGAFFVLLEHQRCQRRLLIVRISLTVFMTDADQGNPISPALMVAYY